MAFYNKLFFLSSFILINFINTYCVFSQDTLTKRKWYDDISFDGYIQVQCSYTNKADSLSLNSPNSGRFDRFVSNKFSVRRGRIQMQYHKAENVLHQ